MFAKNLPSISLRRRAPVFYFDSKTVSGRRSVHGTNSMLRDGKKERSNFIGSFPKSTLKNINPASHKMVKIEQFLTRS
jgi:hypothetical protein